MIVSSRSRAYRFTTPTTSAAETDPITAPSIGANHGSSICCRNSATPIPPSAACDAAPASELIRRVTTIVPTMPSETLESAPMISA